MDVGDLDESDAPMLLLRSLVELTRAFENRVLAQAGHHDLRPAMLAVFRYLEPTGSRIRDLADAAGMTGQAMGELVTRARELGYVAVAPDPRDGRVRLVTLTDRGGQAVAEYAERVRAVEAELRADLGETRVEDLHRLVSAARQALGP